MSESHNFDRRSTDTQIGYITGKIESLEERFEEHMASEADVLKKLLCEIEHIKKQLSLYQHLILFLKTLFLFLGALAAFNWDGARILLQTLLHGGK